MDVKVENLITKTENVNFDDRKEVLRIALENEIRGRELYLQYAKTVKLPLSKRIFEELADQELKHIEDCLLYTSPSPRD